MNVSSRYTYFYAKNTKNNHKEENAMKYGYVRVSTKEQNIDRQMVAMEEVGIEADKIYIEKISGKTFNRPRYKALLRKLKAGDDLYIKSIDRLGRNYEEIIEQWNTLIKVKNIDIVVLDFPLLNTRNNVNGLTGKFISDLVLQVLSYVAQMERENIKQRQMEGIREAKKRGVQFGRPPLELPEQFDEVIKGWKAGEMSLCEASRRLNVSHRTVAKWIKIANNE